MTELKLKLKTSKIKKYNTEYLLLEILPEKSIYAILDIFKFSKIFGIIALNQNQRLKCIVCKKPIVLAFTIITTKKKISKNQTIMNLKWICHTCIQNNDLKILLKVLLSFSEEFYDFFLFSINVMIDFYNKLKLENKEG